jgi:hypothetical protein
MSEEIAAPYLSDLEVEELTGYIQPRRQARWLVENGFRPMINGRGKVRVARDAMSARQAAAIKSKTEPDFSRIRRTG